MRFLRLLAAALLLVPSVETARAAERVVSAPAAPLVRPVSLPTVSALPAGVSPVSIPALALPAALAPAEPAALNARKVSDPQRALPQAQLVLHPERQPEQAARAAFDGGLRAEGPREAVAAAPPSDAPQALRPATPAPRVVRALPKLDALAPFRARRTRAAVGGLSVAAAVLVVAGPLVTLASAVYAGPVVALAAVVAGAVPALRRPAAAPSDPPVSLEEEDADALLARSQAIVDALVVRMGRSRSEAPKVELSNEDGRANAWAAGRLDSDGRIGLGEGYAGRTDRQLAGALAHELGHLEHGDSERRVLEPDLGARAGWTSLTTAVAVAAGSFVAHGWSPETMQALTVAGAGLAVTGLGLAAIAKVSRLLERRADRFSAWLTRPSWLASDLTRGLRGRREGLIARVFSSHPEDFKRVRALRRMPREGERAQAPPDELPVPLALAEPKPLSSYRAPYWVSKRERLARGLGGPMMLYAPLLPMIFVHPGLTFAALAVVGARVWWKSRGRDEKDGETASSLSEEQQRKLLSRGRKLSTLLVARLGLPEEKEPTVILSNSRGRHNAWVSGKGFGPETKIGLGDDWFYKSDRELAGVLAHEFGHVVARDGSQPFHDTELLGDLAWGLWFGAIGVYLVWVGLLFAGEATATPTRILWSSGATAAAMAMPALSHYLLKLASRLRERRADYFAAWLTHPRWLAEFFHGDRRHAEAFSTHPLPSRRVGWLARQAARLGRNPPPAGPKGPGASL